MPAPEYRQNKFMVYATVWQHGDAVTTEKTTEKILSLILENPNITTEELARVCDIIGYVTIKWLTNGSLMVLR